MTIGSDSFVENHIDDLEAVMVKLFRVFQTLLTLVKEERQHLIARNAEALENMFDEKSTVLANIAKLETERNQKTKALAVSIGCGNNFETLSDVLVKIPGNTSDRIRHIQQGILSLQKEIREINDGNFALANLNLQQVQAVQEFLITALQPPSSYYGPNSNSSNFASPSTWQMDQNV